MIKLSDKSASEMAEMRQLWMEAFEYSEEFTDFYFSYVCLSNKIIVLKEEGILTGMLHLNPYTFSNAGHEHYRTYFITGAAVREGYRQQGRLKRMLQYAYSVLESEGIRFVYLQADDERYFSSSGFQTVTQMAEIRFRKEDISLLKDEMINSRSDVEFGKLIGQMILPYYSGENLRNNIAAMHGRYDRYITVGKQGMVQGYYSIFVRGDTVYVDNFVPYYGLRQITSKLFKDIEAVVYSVASDIAESIEDMDLTEDSVLDEQADEQSRVKPDTQPGNSQQYIKNISITMDTRLVNCYSQTLDMNQVRLSRKYMLAELRESAIDYGGLVFSELI